MAGKGSKDSKSEIQVECSETSPVLRSIRVEIDAARVDAAFDRAYRDLAKTARIKGFRPGKVPRSVLERMYGAGLPEEIERVLVSETLAEAIEKAEVTPVSEPDVDAERPEPGAAFRYTASVEVRPAIELPDLGELTGRRPLVAVGDDEIDAELERLRERNAPLIEEPEGTEAADGHTVTIDFEGRIDGEVFPGGSAKGADIQLGSGMMIPGFEEQLVGARAGDDRQVEVTFPDDYGPEELNGRQAVFDCHVVAVKRKALPDLDDEFAKDLGDFETLDDLRARMRSDFEARRESQARQVLQSSLMESLIEASDFEVPPRVVDRQLQSQLRSLHGQYHGKVPDEVLHDQLSRMQEQGRPAAERRVREAFLLDALAEAEGIEVGEEEVEARLAEMAGAQGMEVGKLRSMALQQGWIGAIEHELRDQKVYEVLESRAQIEAVAPEDVTGADAD